MTTVDPLLARPPVPSLPERQPPTEPPAARHELRTLLNQIIGYSELLIEEAQDWEHEGLALDLQKIRAAGQKVLRLTEQGTAPGVIRRPVDTAVQGPREAGVAPMVLPGLLLLVDDDENNCDMLSRRLQHDGHTVHIARSGPEALALASQHPFDLILLDLMMPGMNGQEVLQRLKADPLLRDIPVIMLSAIEDLDIVVRCIELGAEDYLPKPFPPLLLQARIGACMEKKRLRQQEELRRSLPEATRPLRDKEQESEGEGDGDVEGDDDEAEAEPARRRGPAGLLAETRTVPVRLDLDYGALLKVGGALFLLWFVGKAWSVAVLLLISLMLVATLSPLVRRVEARFNRRWGIVLVAVAVVSVAAGLLGILIPPLVRQVQSLVLHFPNHAQTIEATLRRWRMPISLSSFAPGWTRDAAPQLINVASTMLSGFVELTMVAVLTIYLLIDGPGVEMSLIRLLPRSERLAVRRVLTTIADRVGSYMRGQLLASAMAGLFAFLLCLVCRVPEPLALAVWIAVADAIPLVGLMLGVIPAALLALTQGTTTALIVGAGYLLYHQIEVTIIVPRIYGSSMKLSGSAILVSILVGAKLMGVVGGLIALPVAAALPVVLRYIGQWRDRESDRRGAALAPAAKVTTPRG